MENYRNFINGEWIASSSQELMPVINPATEEVINHVQKSNQEDVDQAVAAAKAAFPAWNALSVDQRLAYLEIVYDGLKKYADLLVKTTVLELGASVNFAKDNHIPMAIKEMREYMDSAKDFDFEEEIDGARVIKEGFGVVACITPWNYPLNQIQRKVTPALIAGNTVVVKPASNTPLTALVYAKVFEEADLPHGVFNLVTGSGSEVGDYLAGHPDVAVISFTGSTEVGRGLYEKAAPNIKKLILELGGKSVMLYLAGGDKDLAVKKSMDSILNNQGQTCSAFTRLLVPEAELEEFKKLIESYYQDHVHIGMPGETETMVGPMVSAQQKETVLDYIQKGIDEGAELFLGGQDIDHSGFYVQPTVFTQVDNQMTIAQEEIFGPVLCVLTYKDEEEALAIANDSAYGLSGYVVGPKEKAVAMAEQLRTGNVFVNHASGSSRAPFGGYKESGLGREKGPYGIADYLEIKTIFV
ncbi:aldehyde dehydrogenase family protein [Aerococcus loyolae]|uniref:aldehyde dehydrogenase family protein n=1 Tax=Aerococcus loyolae TaxID=2976809 RepID=UPI0012471CB6|nr:aldehyde dehydrogenase family protein [Aerococcus loyolae]KAA9220484.1 aldehyde dehydrogenase family protein [Aerococcus loyolae]